MRRRGILSIFFMRSAITFLDFFFASLAPRPRTGASGEFAGKKKGGAVRGARRLRLFAARAAGKALSGAWESARRPARISALERIPRRKACIEGWETNALFLTRRAAAFLLRP